MADKAKTNAVNNAETAPSNGSGILALILFITLVVLIILFIWYKSVADKNKAESEEKTEELRDTIKRLETELEQMNFEVKQRNTQNINKKSKEILEVIEVKMDKLVDEFKKNQFGEDYEDISTLKSNQQLKRKIEELMEQNQNLRKELEAMRKSVLIPETKHITQKLNTEEEATPEFIVRNLINELEQNRNLSMKINKENRELNANYVCLQKQIQLKEANIKDLQDQVETSEKHRMINKLLEQQLCDLQAEIKALKQVNEEKYEALGRLMDEGRKKDDMIQKLTLNLCEEKNLKKETTEKLTCTLEKSTKILHDNIKYFEDLIKMLRCINCELSPNNLEEVREILCEKVYDLQRTLTRIKNDLAFSNCICTSNIGDVNNQNEKPLTFTDICNAPCEKFATQIGSEMSTPNILTKVMCEPTIKSILTQKTIENQSCKTFKNQFINSILSNC